MENRNIKTLRKENIMNQLRFLILTVASECIKNSKTTNLKNLLKVLENYSQGALKIRAKKLSNQNTMFLINRNYFFLVIWQLSLDHEEASLLID
jgi:hypothetical protein